MAWTLEVHMGVRRSSSVSGYTLKRPIVPLGFGDGLDVGYERMKIFELQTLIPQSEKNLSFSL